MPRHYHVLAVLCFFVSLSAASQQYEQILIPIHIAGEQRGAHGAIWVGILRVLNASNRELVFRPPDLLPAIRCPAFDPCIDRILAGGVYPGGLLGLPGTRNGPGIMLYVNRDVADDVAISLSIGDRARDGVSDRTEIPIVRERDFLTGASHFVIVNPTSERRRSLLRIYDPDNRPGGAVLVRAYDDSGQLVAERVIQLAESSTFFASAALPVYPAYAQLEIDNNFLPPSVSPNAILRLTLEPAGTTQRYWAFVTATSNFTNELTTISPR